jgi:hypothetical protein
MLHRAEIIGNLSGFYIGEKLQAASDIIKSQSAKALRWIITEPKLA